MRHSNVRRWVGGAVALAAALSLAACNRPGAEGAEGGGPIRIGIGIDASYAPFFLAAEEGMFEDAGLDVELVQFGSGGEAVQAIAGQQVEMAASSETTILTLMAQNPDLRAMLIYQQSGRYLKLVARDEVEGPTDIKKIGVVPGLSDYMARKYFEANDVPVDDVEFVESAPPELPVLTEKGDLDAYLLWEPWPTKGVELGLKEVTDTGSYGYSYVHWTTADEQWLEANEEEAAKVAEVLAESAGMVAEDPAQAAAAVEAQATIPAAEAQQAIELVDWGVRGFTDEDMKSYDEQVAYFVDKGIFDEPIDVGPLVLTDWYDENVAD